MNKADWCGVMVLVSLSIFTVVACVLMLGFTHNVEYKRNLPLVSMSTGDGIKGRFFLGGGSIDDVQYFFYYTRSNDGSMRRVKIEQDMAVIYEDIDNPSNAYAVIYENKRVMAGIELNEPPVTTRIDFHIPKGSITQSFEMN